VQTKNPNVIRVLRLTRGLAQADLALACGVSPATARDRCIPIADGIRGSPAQSTSTMCWADPCASQSLRSAAAPPWHLAKRSGGRDRSSVLTSHATAFERHAQHGGRSYGLACGLNLSEPEVTSADPITPGNPLRALSTRPAAGLWSRRSPVRVRSLTLKESPAPAGFFSCPPSSSDGAEVTPR
jgi:hypothetical protein